MSDITNPSSLPPKRAKRKLQSQASLSQFEVYFLQSTAKAKCCCCFYFLSYYIIKKRERVRERKWKCGIFIYTRKIKFESQMMKTTFNVELFAFSYSSLNDSHQTNYRKFTFLFYKT
jgi:hypothetical protein